MSKSNFKISDYFFTLSDAGAGIMFVVHKVRNLKYRDWFGILMLAIIFTYFYIGFNISADAIFFVSFIFILLVWRIDSRVSIYCALFGLVLIILTQALQSYIVWLDATAISEQLAIYVFYFLAIGVIVQIIELILTQKSARVTSKVRMQPKTTERERLRRRMYFDGVWRRV